MSDGACLVCADGFALLRFQLLMDKANLELSELKVTKSDLMEEFNAEKKKMRVSRRRRGGRVREDDGEDTGAPPPTAG